MSELTIRIFHVTILIGLIFGVLIFANYFKNSAFHKSKTYAFAGAIILCRERIIFGFEIAGILLLVLKISFSAPDQSDYNRILAEAVLANVHSTATIYQVLRKDIPAMVPDGFDATKVELPKTLVPGDPEKLFPELDLYVRKSSKTLAQYFGQTLPECAVLGANVRILSLAPDAEIVNFEINRNQQKTDSPCKSFDVSNGISTSLLNKNFWDSGIEISGGILLFFAAFLKLIEILHKDRRRKYPKESIKWYWNENNLR